jgi:hypothetical protein
MNHKRSLEYAVCFCLCHIPPLYRFCVGKFFLYLQPSLSFFLLLNFFLSIFSPHCTCSSLSYFTLLWFICPIIIPKKISALLHNFVISVFPWSSYPVHYIPLTAEIESPSVVNVSHFSLLSFCCFGRQISYECILSMLFKMLSQIITHLYIV